MRRLSLKGTLYIDFFNEPLCVKRQSSYECEAVAVLPLLLNQTGDLTALRIRLRCELVHKTIGLDARNFESFPVAHQIGIPEHGKARLARADDLSGPAHLEVDLGNAESVI